MKSAAAKTAAKLRRLGFDRSYVDRESGYAQIWCSQCEAFAVNGVAIHERGCPNEK